LGQEKGGNWSRKLSTGQGAVKTVSRADPADTPALFD